MVVEMDVGSNTGLFVDGKNIANGVSLIALDGDFRKNVTEKRCGCKFASAKEVWLVERYCSLQ